MTEGETDKALISEVQESDTLITVMQAEDLIKKSQEKYKKNPPRLDQEENSIILDILSSKEQTSLLSVSHIMSNYHNDEEKTRPGSLPLLVDIRSVS